MSSVWAQSGNDYYLRQKVQQEPLLQPGIYTLCWDSKRNEFYVSFVQSQYTFPYKLYNLDDEFIKRVVTSYGHLKGNLGILMNGVKGSGKTVTAKQICNKLNLPVILIDRSYNGIPEFINNITQDVIIFVDEFEKVFPRDNNPAINMLSIMDGAMDNGFRRVFLMTTNDLFVNTNMIQRPGRIRYIKSYDDLPRNVIMEIVDDKLKHSQWRQQAIDFISKLEIITVDIVSAIIDEINIHNEPPAKFESVFNVKRASHLYNVYELPTVSFGSDSCDTTEKKLLHRYVSLENNQFNHDYIGNRFRVNKTSLGYIAHIITPQTLVLTSSQDAAFDFAGDITKLPGVKIVYFEQVDGQHRYFLGI